MIYGFIVQYQTPEGASERKVFGGIKISVPQMFLDSRSENMNQCLI
tara:strand:- start:157 stop:294 length:138 start_codon:yes stop_codon:yes gene_type:complete